MSLSYYREEEGKAAPLQLGRPSSLAPGVKLKNKTKKELAHILPDIFKIETYARYVQ